MIPTASLPHRITIIAREADVAAGARYGNRELVEVRRYTRVPARVDDVSATEEVIDRDRTDTYFDVLTPRTFRGAVLDFDAHALIVWHRDDGDLDLDLDGEPALVDAGIAHRHLELRARRTRG